MNSSLFDGVSDCAGARVKGKPEVIHNRKTRYPIPGMDFAGGALLAGAWAPDPKKVFTAASLNLTPDPSGISYFDEKIFINALRTGTVNARALANIMPWAFFQNLSDDDLGSMFAYLQTLKPVQHRVDNTEPLVTARCAGASTDSETGTKRNELGRILVPGRYRPARFRILFARTGLDDE
jgi:hypothetical protein